MIQIHNITQGSGKRRVAITTKAQGMVGFPRLLDLMPGTTITISKQNLHDYHQSVKQEIADFVAHGMLKVVACNSSHLYQDRGNMCDYDYDYLLPGAQPLALEHALQVAGSLSAAIDAHVQSTAFHNAATAAIGVAVPTDLATLLLWIAGAQTAYETNHRPSGAAHPFVDAVNALAPVAAVDLPTAVQALQELHRAYTSHRTWLVGATELNIPSIVTF